MRLTALCTVGVCLVAAILSAAVFSTAAYGQASREFNWTPSGTIDVGNLESENAASYRSVGDIIEAPLAYSDGMRPDGHGRRTNEEIFVINVARWRGGPCSGALVIRRQVDTATPPDTLAISLDGQDCGTWTRPALEGDRRFADVFYVIPAKALLANPDDPNSTKWTVTMKITAQQPYDSYGYSFFITRDWGLMPEAYLGAIAPREGDDSAAATYLNGLVKEGDHRWEEAAALYRAAAGKSGDFDFSRCIRRRIRLCDYYMSATKVVDTRENMNFDTHYALGQYCASNDFWNEALAEYTKAVEADPASGDATYNMAEAMEYCYKPIAEWAPLMGRAGALYKRPDVNETTVQAAINMYELPDGPDKRVKAPLPKSDMDALYRDWTYVTQIVYGTSRGAWHLVPTFVPYTEKDPKWVLWANWLWVPPDSAIPKFGMYDHTMGFAAWGASDAGGIDCGPAWSGDSNIGPTRSWEVMIHEWNHQFDWNCIFSEEGPGYPTTHDSDGCGKQPIVDMGCGHRSSMRYYLTPAQYRRLEPSDPDIPHTHIRTWAVYGPLDAPALKGTTGEELVSELLNKKLATQDDINWIRGQADQKKTDLADEVRDWYVASHQMDLVKATDNEAAFSPKVEPKKWRTVTDNDHNGQVDLAAVFPDAAPKAYAYACTYIWSPKDQEVRVWYGFHDCMRVWFNQRMVHKGLYYTVARFEDSKWLDMLAAHFDLKQGWNSLLVKVERCAGKGGYGLSNEKDWSFSVNLVDFNNNPLPELKYQTDVPRGEVAVYVPPEVGKYYRWDDVKEDFIEMLPRLTQDDLRKLTGIPELTLTENAYLAAIPASAVQKGSNAITLEAIKKAIAGQEYEGKPVTPVNFLDLPIPGTPQGQEPTPFNAFKTALFQDVTLNNFLNFDQEGAAALRYVKNGQPRDLLFIRPEYFYEYLALINDAKSGLPGRTADRILGYWFIERAAYPSTGNRTWRAVLVAETYLGDQYPTDEQDILAVPAPPATQ
jgi:hypothetical protein